MKKFLFALMAVCLTFAMISCGDKGGGGGGGEKVKITLNYNWATGGPDATEIEIAKGGSLALTDLAAPTAAQTPAGKQFYYWVSSTSAESATRILSTTTFATDDVIYAYWVDDDLIRVKFNWNYNGAPEGGDYDTLFVEEDGYLDFDEDLPAYPKRDGFKFYGWWPNATIDTEEDDEIDWEEWYATADMTVYARWLSTKLTVVAADGFVERAKLGNAARAIFKFELPYGATFADYKGIQFEWKVDEASLENRVLNGRVYGDLSFIFEDPLFDPENYVESDYLGEQVFGLNFNDVNKGGLIANRDWGDGTMKDGKTADTWNESPVFLFGAGDATAWGVVGDGGAFNGKSGKPAPEATGPFYFGIGLSGNAFIDDYRSDGANSRYDGAINQALKNIKLVPKVSGDTGFTSAKAAVFSTGSGFDVAPLCGYSNVAPAAGAGIQSEQETLQAAAGNITVTYDWGYTGAPKERVFAVRKYLSSDTLGSKRPVDPARANYNFTGWFTAESGGTAVDFAANASAETTFYARWAIIESWLVTFDPNYVGSSPILVYVVKTTPPGTITEAKVPTVTQPGFKFAGWFAAAAGGTAIDKATIGAVAPSTDTGKYYAHWTEVPNDMEIDTGLPSGSFSTTSTTALTYTFTDDLEGYTHANIEILFTRDSGDAEVDGAWRPMKMTMNGANYNDIQEATPGSGDPTTKIVTITLPVASLSFSWNNWPTGASAPYDVEFVKITLTYPEEEEEDEEVTP